MMVGIQTSVLGKVMEDIPLYSVTFLVIRVSLHVIYRCPDREKDAVTSSNKTRLPALKINRFQLAWPDLNSL